MKTTMPSCFGVLWLGAIMLCGCQARSYKMQATFDNSLQKSESNCEQHIAEYSEALQSYQLWALKMLDATSKLQPGIFAGNVADFGDFEECLSVDINTWNGSFFPKYCTGSLTTALDIVVENNTSIKKDLELLWSMCIPSSCEAEEAASHILSFFNSYWHVNNVTMSFDEDLCQLKDDAYPNISSRAALAIGIILFLVIATLGSTGYEMYLQYNQRKTNNKILTSFSIFSNGKLFLRTTTDSDEISCLNGMRVFSLLWIVFAHEFSINLAGPGIRTSGYMSEVSPASMYIRGGNFAVDTFFVIGGLLLGYGYLKSIHKGITFNIVKFYLNRIIRILPVLAVVVLVSATLLEYLGSGPYYPLYLSYFKEPCVDHWWSALLFLQNYINVERMCVGHSWYLNVDMQLYVLSPLILLPYKRYRKLVLVFITTLIIGSMAAAFGIAWYYNLAGVVGNTYGNSVDYSNYYYLRTHTRASPWLLGLVCGFYIHTIKQEPFKPPKLNILLLWIVGGVFTVASIFCGYPLIENKSKWGNSLYIALVRPVWSFGLCCIIVACIFHQNGYINRFLSLKIFKVLGRLVYGVYLVHVLMMYGSSYAVKSSTSYDVMSLMHRLWGDLAFSAILTIFLLLMVEYPFVAIGKCLL